VLCSSTGSDPRLSAAARAGLWTDASVLLVPTFQSSTADLVAFTPEAEAEKNRLLHGFYTFARAVRERIRAAPRPASASNATNAAGAAAAVGAVAKPERSGAAGAAAAVASLSAAAGPSASRDAADGDGAEGAAADAQRYWWADWIDPCSGSPALGRAGPSLYPEVESAACLLRYRTESVGCCGLIAHPKWGTRCYPATLFTDAPHTVLLEAIRTAVAEAEAAGAAAGVSAGAKPTTESAAPSAGALSK
jgi:hypothetical protein